MEGPPVCKLSQASCQIERRFVEVIVVAIGFIELEILNDYRSNYNTTITILKETTKDKLLWLALTFQDYDLISYLKND
jgi:hypothetical protein